MASVKKEIGSVDKRVIYIFDLGKFWELDIVLSHILFFAAK